MAEEIKPVESVAGTGEVDWEARYQEQTARLAKAEKAAADYRSSWKAAKKSSDVDTALEPVDQVDQTEIMRRIAAEAVANSTVEQEKKALENINLEMARKLKEATLALNNKAGMSTASMGSGEGNNMPDVKSDFWSADQIAELKKKGMTDDMIKAAAKRAQAGSQYPLR